MRTLTMAETMSVIIATIALIISLISLKFNFAVEEKNDKARLEVWQRNSYFEGGEDNRTEVTLIIRNLGRRPTAIIDIQVRKDDVALGGPGYHRRITLPIKLEPWDVRFVTFRLEKNDEEAMSHILITDIEGKVIKVDRRQGIQWFKATHNTGIGGY